MRIIVFGGAGDVGSLAVEELASTSDVEQVTIADRAALVAESIATRLGDGVDTLTIDAMDHRAVVEAMRGYDVAASALGPFYIFEERLVRAALEAGVDYVSICDDWTAANTVLGKFDDRARAANRTIVTGVGASPGLTNIAARHLAHGLDSVEHIDISVYQPLDAGGGSAVLDHMIFIMTGEPQIWRNGEAANIPACSVKRRVEFPRYGHIWLWNMGHAEPVTLPQTFPDLKACGFFMGYGGGSRLLVGPARLGLFNGRRRRGLSLWLLEQIERYSRPEEPAEGAIRVDVLGKLRGKPVHRTACGVGAMREATAIPLAVGTLLVGRGQTVVRGGVLPADAAFDTDVFIDGVQDRGIEAYEDISMTRRIGTKRCAAGRCVG